MRSLKIVVTVLIVLLVLASCAPAHLQQPTEAPSVSETAAPSQAGTPAAQPAETAEPESSAVSFGEGSDDPNIWLPGDPYKWSALPMSVPVINDGDLKIFNPDKTVDYLVAGGCGHDYSLKKAQLINGILYLTITDDRYLLDINTAYKYFKTKFSLSDDVILSLPLFSGCVIHDGVMYLDDSTWQSSKKYDSYEEWESAMGGYANSIDFGSITLPPVPVSGGAKISLCHMKDSGKEYTNLTEQQFQDYILSGKTEIDFTSDSGLLDSLYFNYSNGDITAIFQDRSYE